MDLITVQAELARRGTLEGVGGVSALTALMLEVPTTANVSYYVALVREKATYRKLIEQFRRPRLQNL